MNYWKYVCIGGGVGVDSLNKLLNKVSNFFHPCMNSWDCRKAFNIDIFCFSFCEHFHIDYLTMNSPSH